MEEVLAKKCKPLNERESGGPSKRSEGVMGNLSLYVAREPPSTSLARVLALKDRSFTCGSFASRTRSLATPFTHSLESDSITADFLEDRSFLTLLLLPAESAATDGAYYHIERSEA